MKITKTELKQLIKEALVEELGRKSSKRRVREEFGDYSINDFKEYLDTIEKNPRKGIKLSYDPDTISIFIIHKDGMFKVMDLDAGLEWETMTKDELLRTYRDYIETMEDIRYDNTRDILDQVEEMMEDGDLDESFKRRTRR